MKELFNVWKKLRQRVRKNEDCTDTKDNVGEEKSDESTSRQDIFENNEILRESSTLQEYEQTISPRRDTDNSCLKDSSQKLDNGFNDNSLSQTTNEFKTPSKPIKIIQNILVKPSLSFESCQANYQKNVSETVTSTSSISSSFLDHIYWPEESPDKKPSKRKRERLPYATTSKRWLQYHEEKQNIKKAQKEQKSKKV